jgi:hypothetical protein
MRRPLLLLALCGLLLPAGLSAQLAGTRTDSTAAPPSAEQLALAHQLVPLLGMTETAAAGVKIMLDQLVQVNPTLAPYRGAMEQWAHDIFAGNEAWDAYAELYARSFTATDLRALITFFQTPAGQHLSARQAELATGGAEIGRRLAQEHQAELLARIQQSGAKP